MQHPASESVEARELRLARDTELTEHVREDSVALQKLRGRRNYLVTMVELTISLPFQPTVLSSARASGSLLCLAPARPQCSTFH